MDERQRTLLGHVIEEYTKTAQPVGSGLIADKYMRDLSSPTVRNEMQVLEREGFIHQPHTSAGRVPTEQGYRFYLENLMPEREVSGRHEAALKQAWQDSRDYEEKVKSLAKKTAEMVNQVVIAGFSPHDTFYTGLANLFNKPEFASQELVVSLSRVIDHLDEVMSKIHKQMDDDITVLLGNDNPFDEECGSVMTSWKFNRGQGVIAILGPMRMDYGESIAFVKFIKKLLER